MSRILKSAVRPLAVLAMVGFLVSMTPIEAAGPGRENSRCKRTCNSTERLCKDPCFDTCTEMFPGDDVAIGSCTGECNAACRDAKHECNIVCNVLRDDTTPEEP